MTIEYTMLNMFEYVLVNYEGVITGTLGEARPVAAVDGGGPV